MACRVILVPLFGGKEDAAALQAAFRIAKRFDGHAVALHALPDPRDVIPVVGEGMSADMIQRLIESAAAAGDQQRAAAKAIFEQARAAAEIELCSRPDAAAGPSVGWLEISGRPESMVPARALLSDLVVFGRAGGEALPQLRITLEAVLLQARRPLLLAPAALPNGIGHRIAIAWNGTAEAAAALAAARPLLDAATKVHVLTAATPRTGGDAAGELADYLAWRGIASEQYRLEPSDEPVDAALLRKAHAVHADLLVMGGYGHTRLRERILGGVTHHVLQDAELPVLLAH